MIGGAPYTIRVAVTAADISDASTAGKALLTAEDANVQLIALGIDGAIAAVNAGSGISGFLNTLTASAEVNNGIVISLEEV